MNIQLNWMLAVILGVTGIICYHAGLQASGIFILCLTTRLIPLPNDLAVSERNRYKAALEKIGNPDGRFEGEGECEAIARKALPLDVEANP